MSSWDVRKFQLLLKFWFSITLKAWKPAVRNEMLRKKSLVYCLTHFQLMFHFYSPWKHRMCRSGTLFESELLVSGAYKKRLYLLKGSALIMLWFLSMLTPYRLGWMVIVVLLWVMFVFIMGCLGVFVQHCRYGPVRDHLTANLRSLTAHIYHVMITVTGGKSLLLFLRNSFGRSWTCIFGI